METVKTGLATYQEAQAVVIDEIEKMERANASIL